MDLQELAHLALRMSSYRRWRVELPSENIYLWAPSMEEVRRWARTWDLPVLEAWEANRDEFGPNDRVALGA